MQMQSPNINIYWNVVVMPTVSQEIFIPQLIARGLPFHQKTTSVQTQKEKAHRRVASNTLAEREVHRANGFHGNRRTDGQRFAEL